MTLRPDVPAVTFEESLAGVPEVMDAVHLTGGSDYLVRVVARDPGDLDRVIYAIKACGAAGTQTRLVLRRLQGFGVTRLLADDRR